MDVPRDADHPDAEQRNAADVGGRLRRRRDRHGFGITSAKMVPTTATMPVFAARYAFQWASRCFISVPAHQRLVPMVNKLMFTNRR
jgi:hypothetical protein